MPRETVAQTIEDIADRIANGETTYELHVATSAAEQALLEFEHIEGLRLLNRVGLLLLTNNGTENVRYPIVQKMIEKLTPLDTAADSEALRSLAREIRTT